MRTLQQIFEGIFDIDDIETSIENEIVAQNKSLINALTGGGDCKIEFKNDTLYITSKGSRSQGVSIINNNILDGNVIRHIVCDVQYSIHEWDVPKLVGAGIKSITAPTIHLFGRCEMDGTVFSQLKLNAENFIVVAYDDRTKTSTINNINLKCKGTVKMISNQASWGDQLILNNVTVNCKKLILASHQNFNYSIDSSRRGNWITNRFSAMGLTPESKFKQIYCLDDKEYPEEAVKYTNKRPAKMDSQSKWDRDDCWEMLDKPGWYCEKRIKATKAMLKVPYK